MADLSLLQEDLQEEIEGFGVDDYSSESDVIIIPSALDFVSQDEMLTPLGRLDKYAASENVFNRQMVARSLLDTLKEVSDDERDCIAVLERVSRLADDAEPTVRAELMEQVPHIALFCQENRPSIPYAFSKYLLPIVVRYLADQNNQIMCKMAPMVGKDITERLILPRFCEMCCDCRMFHVRKVCAANFGDICSVVGQQATEEMLLPRFFQLCSDNVWGVRKACAECFMAVSCATSQEIRRTKLSTLFINLISDPSRWVRQAAFQSLGPFISTFANPSSSGQYFKEENKNLEDIVLEEKNSETIRDGDRFSENVQFRTEDIPLDVCLCKSSLRLENNLEDHTKTCRKSLSESHIYLDRSLHSTLSSVSLHILQEAVDELEQSSGNLNTTLLPEMDISSPESSLTDQELYNSFHFWRTPLPEIDLDLELELEQDTEKTLDPESPEGAPEVTIPDSPNITMATRKELEEMIENLEPHIDDPDVKAQVEVLSAALRATSMDTQEEKLVTLGREDDLQDEILIKELQNCKINQDDPVPLINDSVESMDSTINYMHNDSDLSTDSFSPEEERKSKVQDVVPQALLDQYLSMTDPSRAQTVDTEIAKHCAYSLPGVALTLGRQNWHCLRETYETLASDMQWKVRRTLAFSIHELAIILGDQLTAADLVPIFNGFLKDLDEVRIGVLKHLHDFLKLLHIDKRREYLYQLQEFLVTDNSRNWRFRAELAEQLILLLDLYSPRDVYDYLRPIALNLCADKVSSVRWISYKLVSEMVKKLHMATPSTFGVDLINELVESFGRCPKWSGRQTFVFVCQTVIEDDCLPMDQFAVHLMPHLLNLANDSVPNVRVLLAKTLRQTLLEKEYFLSSANSHQEAVEQTIMALQMDSDSDVKYFASIHPSSNKIAEDAMSTASSTY
uniref:Serine/threonine-protein phosphatase 4 regulatory subunit 1 n=1 Tax=Vombatus ursinus TaxID=29139 RepID=A0A4X2LZ02_VOMUR